MVGYIAVGVVLAAHSLCNRIRMVLGGLMVAELGKGFSFLPVDFAVQLPAGFPGALRFGLFTRTAFDDPRRLPAPRPW